MVARLAGLQFGILFSMCSAALFAQTQVAPELQVVAAQPAVFVVNVRGDFDLTYPKALAIRKEQLIEDAAALKQAGKFPQDSSAADELWITLLADPGKYLLASTETTTAYVRGRVFGAGTAFAVSREGILISNAHVFLDPNDQSLTGLRNDLELQALFAGPTAEMLLQELGGAPSEALREPVFYSIIDWTGRTMTAKGEFKSAELVLQYAAPKKALSSMIFAAPEPITVPLEILAKGEAAPGKDVAILRAIMQPDDREKLKAGGARDDEIDDLVAEAQNDKLICLTLGSAQDVLPGAKVQSLGFPGSAFLSDWMTEAAAYRVSARDGQVGQMKPVRGGYEMIEMTAGIDHGDSGGPLLDSDGRVIGINVGGGSNNATTLAVPIDVAREFLNKAGIEPDPGTLTIRWHEGLAAYQKGDFQRAWELFDLVRKNQGSDMALSAVPNRLELQAQQPFGARRTETLLTPNLVNPYVEAMQKRAAAKIK